MVSHAAAGALQRLSFYVKAVLFAWENDESGKKALKAFLDLCSCSYHSMKCQISYHSSSYICSSTSRIHDICQAR